MALIVAPDAGYDSLVSLTDAAAYMSDMGHTDWGGMLEADREIALRRATQYLLSAYTIRPEFLNPVDPRVAAACCEAALRSINAPLLVDVDPVSVRSKSVGPISTTYAFPRNGGQVRYGVIDALLRGLTLGGGVVQLVRA